MTARSIPTKRAYPARLFALSTPISHQPGAADVSASGVGACADFSRSRSTALRLRIEPGAKVVGLNEQSSTDRKQIRRIAFSLECVPEGGRDADRHWNVGIGDCGELP